MDIIYLMMAGFIRCGLLYLVIGFIFCIVRLIYNSILESVKTQQERKEIQERTDLEIEGMKKRISAECTLGMTHTMPCNHCKVGKVCKRCYDIPGHNGCDDWETDDVLAAYELLKEDK